MRTTPPVVRFPGPPGSPVDWRGPLREVDRWEWREGDAADPAVELAGFLAEHDLAGEPVDQQGSTVVALLAGATGCARLAGLPGGRSSPVPAVPELAAVAYRRDAGSPAGGSPAGGSPAGGSPAPGSPAGFGVGPWASSWSDLAHAAAIETVREAIARGDLYQANVVGHRSAAHRTDPGELAATVSRLPGATYGGVLAGPGWAVGCASPEQLVRLEHGRLTTVPIKGTLPVRPGSRAELLASVKDRAEHIMIVDLERNDLARVSTTGSVQVEQLYALTDWSGLWQASSTVAARLASGVTTFDLLRVLLPGGSVTGAPKRAACTLLAALEPVGRGPSMGALGLIWPGGLDLGLTIRTIGVDTDRVHLWAGGGITWGSDPLAEVEEAHAKARPVLRALAG